MAAWTLVMIMMMMAVRVTLTMIISVDDSVGRPRRGWCEERSGTPGSLQDTSFVIVIKIIFVIIIFAFVILIL